MTLLDGFDPTAAKDIKKRISKAAGAVVQRARGIMPNGEALSNWGAWSQGGRDLSYRDNGRKIRVTRANMRKRGEAVSNYIGIVNPTPGGAIFELAGRQAPDPRFYGGILSAGYGVSRKSGTGRPGVFKAFDDDKGKAVAEIETALKDAERIVQNKLNALGE
jgi:hypothetical protein